MTPKNTQEVASKADPGEIMVGYRDGVTVLTLLGEHDMATAPKLVFEIGEQAARRRGVVISLSQAEFIDSAIVHALFKGDQSMQLIGRRLVLHVGSTHIVDQVLELAGVTEALLWSVSVDEAVEFASQSSA